MKVNVSQSAREQLESYYSANNKSKDKDYVRVYISRYGWGGPVLSIALDEQKQDDESYEIEGFKILVDSELASSLGSVNIDYSSKWYSKGFTVESDVSSSCS